MKIFSTSSRFMRNAYIAAFGALITALGDQNAFAAGGAGNMAQPIVTILQSIQAVVIGPLGVAVFVLGLAGLGMACLRGMIPWGWVVAWIVGSIFLFGAPTLVSEIQSAVGSSSN